MADGYDLLGGWYVWAYWQGCRECPEPRRADATEIAAVVARKFGVTVDALLSIYRGQRLALARHITMYLIRENTDLTFIAIAKMLRRDHSTVVHGYQKIGQRMAKDKPFADTVAKIARSLAA